MALSNDPRPDTDGDPLVDAVAPDATRPLQPPDEFVKKLPAHLARMQVAFLTGDIERLAALAEAIRDTADTPLLSRIGRQALEIERSAADGVLDRLETQLDELNALVRELRARSGASNP